MRAWLSLFIPVAACAGTSFIRTESISRELDDGYSSLLSGPCVRVKVIEDDDDGEGNSYFYNGAYRAQYLRYVSLSLCSDSSCEHATPYAIDMESYLEIMTDYAKNYCNSCANQCRRRLEEEQEGGGQANVYVDCSTCKDECELMWNDNGGVDETDYLECAEAYDDGDLQYYSSPQCDDGEISIGLYYNEECTIKTYQELDKGFTYPVFKTIQRMELDCSQGACDELLQNAFSCEDGNNNYNRVCKAAEKASKTRTYYKKPWYKKLRFAAPIILITILSGAFCFLSYTYYVRHNTPVPLATLDHEIPEVS